MKKSIFGFSILAILLTGYFLLKKDDEAARARARAALAEEQKEEIADKAARQEGRMKELQMQLRQAQAKAAQPPSKTEALQEQMIGAVAKNSALKNRILSDPKMRKAMEAEAREGTEKNIKSLFAAGLPAQLNLDEAQSAQLFQLLTQKRALFWDKMLLPMMTGEVEEKDMATAGQGIKAAFEENKTRLHELLGDSGLSTYEWFEKTESARDEYKQLNSQLAKAQQPLSEQQQAELNAILTDEHANFKMHYNFDDPAQLDLEHWYDNFSEEKLDVCGQDVEELNDRMLRRAQSVLTSEQLDTFRELLAQRSLKARFVVLTTSAMLARQR
jgi:hypothetical protein